MKRKTVISWPECIFFAARKSRRDIMRNRREAPCNKLHKIELLVSLVWSHRGFFPFVENALVLVRVLRLATYSHFAVTNVSIATLWICYFSQSRLSRRVNHAMFYYFSLAKLSCEMSFAQKTKRLSEIKTWLFWEHLRCKYVLFRFVFTS